MFNLWTLQCPGPATSPTCKILFRLDILFGLHGDLLGDDVDLLVDGVNLLGDGVDLLVDGVDLLGDGVDLLGDGDQPTNLPTYQLTYMGRC